MNKEREALKALIHEMEYVLSCINAEEIPFDGDDFHEALRLGKEALDHLSQPEQEKERCVGCEACIDTACGRDECPKGWPKAAQPEQEPVACIEDGDLYFANEIDWQTLQKQGISVQLLYTTPPQRTEQEQQIETLKRCLFQMQEAAKDLVEQAKSLTPPQRTWVGLTTDDWDEIKKQVKYNFEMTTGEYAERVSHLVENKLREKNT